MERVSSESAASPRVNLVIYCAFLIVVFLFGGASRADVLSLPVVRIASILMIAVALLQINRVQVRQVRTALLFLVAMALVIGLQLVPLPPDAWAGLPARGDFARMLAEVGLPQTWRPLSFTPDLTLNSLLALLPAFAAILGYALIGSRRSGLLIPMLLAGILIQALLGLIQIAGGSPYFYQITNEGAAVGFFSNRNHLAVFLSLALPLMAGWTRLASPDPNSRRLRFWLSICVATGIFPLLLIFGSRAAIGTAVIGAIAAVAISRTPVPGQGNERTSARQWLVFTAPLLIGALAILVISLAGKDVALQRLLADSDDARREFLPIYLQMAKDYFPFGSGFGSFETMFRIYEPSQSLSFSYLNQAHNDLIQMIIEGGVAPLILAGCLFFWYAVRSFKIWLRPVRSPHTVLARVGSAMILQLVVASAVDYPLRTPFLAAVFVLACAWMLPVKRTAGQPEEVNAGVGTGSTVG